MTETQEVSPMNKRRYRTTKVNQVNWQQIAEQAGEQTVVFAVDVAKENFVGALMMPDRTVLKTIKWQHPMQTPELVHGLLSHLGAQRLEVAMEPSGTYGDALRWLFVTHGVAVYRLSPKRVHDSAEVFDGVPSMHDAKAAYQIGRLHLDGVSRRWEERSEQRRELAAQIAVLKLYQERLQSSRSRLEAQLSRHWPELPGVLELGSVTLMKLVAAYGSPVLVATHAEEARELMGRSGGAGLHREKIEGVLEAARQTLGMPCLEAERVLLQTLAQDMLDNHRAIQQVERVLAAQVEADATLSQLATVVGKTSAAVLVYTQGRPQDYPDAASYLKSLGLNLKERSSGKFQGQLRITKRGPGLARLYLYFAALRWLYRDPVIGAWYQRKVARDGGRKGKAIVAIMRKLAKALWYVAQGVAFDSRKLFNIKAPGMAA
jgi:transposase